MSEPTFKTMFSKLMASNPEKIPNPSPGWDLAPGDVGWVAYPAGEGTELVLVIDAADGEMRLDEVCLDDMSIKNTYVATPEHFGRDHM